MNKHNNSGKKSEPTTKRAKPREPMRRDTKEVLAELVGKLKEKLDPKKPAATSVGEKPKRGELRPNLDRLTVGVDLGDQWSNYCILDLEGETLAEGQLRTTQEDLAEFFQALNAARVVFEVGTHSPWVQEVIGGCGHEVLVANPRMMDGSKRRKRKNDRIDANKLARLGRVDPQSLHPIQHRSREVRQDLVVLRAREALVEARTELINATRGKGGKTYTAQVAPGPSHWTGYTTFREGVVINDELVVERPLTLTSAELGKVPASEREYILLNAMPPPSQ